MHWGGPHHRHAHGCVLASEPVGETVAVKKQLSYAPDGREEVELLSWVPHAFPSGGVILVTSERDEATSRTGFPIVANRRVTHGFRQPQFDAALVWARPCVFPLHKDANRPAGFVTHDQAELIVEEWQRHASYLRREGVRCPPIAEGKWTSVDPTKALLV